MSKDKIASVRGIHVSPGIYTAENEISYAVKSLGITTLGLVGETVKGPAFQPVPIKDWREFTSVFGGTNPEKFKGSQYPKYELPYIAKSYLSESNQLQVCRVLGLSGYNAGPAWVVAAVTSDDKKFPVVVLRSRGYYNPYRNLNSDRDKCCEKIIYDGLNYLVGEKTHPSSCTEAKSYNMNALTIGSYINISDEEGECKQGYKLKKGTAPEWNVTPINYGRFTIYGLTGETTSSATSDKSDFKYSVSLNPNDKDYILNVLGTDPQNGTTEVYVESLYDVALKQGIESGYVTKLNDSLIPYEPFNLKDYCTLAPVNGLMEANEASLKRKDVGKRFLATKSASVKFIKGRKYNSTNNKFIVEETAKLPTQENITVGCIYTVKQFTDVNGKRHYFYAKTSSGDTLYVPTSKTATATGDSRSNVLVKNLSDGLYYRVAYTSETATDVRPIECDMNNYRESYRYASTPWIVSNVRGDHNKIELTKLFRFHTISDGNNANFEIKVSIVNIKLDDGTFDVYIRDINDTDASPIILEKYTRCTMIPGDSRYIGYMIGTFDGSYESKSKYVTVEVNEDSVAAKTSIPAGFLGYPLSKFNGLQINASAKTDMMAPKIKYNCNYNDDLKHRKQYFGLSDIVGVDIDSFTYKGQAAYIENDPSYLSDGFHLDCRVNKNAYETGSIGITVSVDGETGYTWQSVSVDARTALLDATPMIDTEANMSGSIFEYVDLRKFTVYFYGGFDGWDVYRASRSNTDDFKQTKYKGDYNEISGEGYSFNRIDNPELLQLNQKGITSDWYAYLSAIRQFANPENVDINVFATPGIDLINNKLLCQEAIDMIEEERADSIYVATIPDKPFGATDFESDMYLPDDLVEELEDTEIDSNYTCTYYPWIKYEDTDNNQFIMLPPTKDVVRNMAMTDNTAQPWFSPAGITRGSVDCVRAHKVTKIADEDVLYEGRINPVKTFASDGVKIWGNKNLQHGDALLTRIHVRRLILRMRKLISIACIGLIFEPNDNTVKSRFLSLVTPIMDNIKSNRGISDYRIDVDDSIEARERRELNARIFFKPYNSLEYINITFVVTPQSITFDEL